MKKQKLNSARFIPYGLSSSTPFTRACAIFRYNHWKIGVWVTEKKKMINDIKKTLWLFDLNINLITIQSASHIEANELRLTVINIPMIAALLVPSLSSETAVAESRNLFLIGSAPVSGHFEPPFPFSTTFLWKELLQVAALPSNEMTPNRVSSIFGVKLTRTELHLMNSTTDIFSVKAYQDWYFDLSLALSSNIDVFSFRWAQVNKNIEVQYPPAPSGICLKLSSSLLNDLGSRGWILDKRIIPSTHDGSYIISFKEYLFVKSSSHLIIAFGPDNCLLGININYKV